MNCKPGDLAIAIRSGNGNEGKVMTCIRYVGEVPFFIGDDYWQTDTPLMSRFGDFNCFYRDSWLRPIRDNDGDDETLTWVGKPNEVTA